jgi:hypothetical protein
MLLPVPADGCSDAALLERRCSVVDERVCDLGHQNILRGHKQNLQRVAGRTIASVPRSTALPAPERGGIARAAQPKDADNTALTTPRCQKPQCSKPRCQKPRCQKELEIRDRCHQAALRSSGYSLQKAGSTPASTDRCSSHRTRSAPPDAAASRRGRPPQLLRGIWPLANCAALRCSLRAPWRRIAATPHSERCCGIPARRARTSVSRYRR